MILPLTVIRRLDRVLEPTKDKVLTVHRQYGDRDAIPQAAADNMSPLTLQQVLTSSWRACRVSAAWWAYYLRSLFGICVRRRGIVVSERHLAVPREIAAKLAGLSHRQVDYWAATGLVEATVDNQAGRGRRVRLYGFVDLMALLVAAELRARGFSLQHIRKLVQYFKSRGIDEPLTELRWATSGKGKRKTIYIQFPDGSWEDNISPGQLVFHEILDLELLRHRIRIATQRDTSTVGQVEQRRGVLGGKPVLAGTRVPVETVRRYLAAGRSVDDILRAFPVLSAADVETVRAETVA